MSLDIRSLWNFNDPAASEATFRAAQASSKDEELELKTQIARTLGLRARFDEARTLLNEVKGALSEETPKAAIRYNLEAGRVENSSGNIDAAIPYFDIALELGEKAGEDFLAVDAAHMLGIAYKGEKSLEWNYKAIEMAKASADMDAWHWQGSLLNNTGWTLHDLGRYEEALDVFRQALDFRIFQEKSDLVLIASYCVGRCLRSLGRYEEALQTQLAITTGDEGYVCEEIAECLLALGERGEAAHHFGRAYELLSADDWFKAHEPARLERFKSLAG